MMTNKTTDIQQVQQMALAIPTSREFLTPEEMAQQLGTTPAALKTIRSRGGGPPYVTVGRSIAYPIAAVRLWSLSVARTSASNHHAERSK